MVEGELTMYYKKHHWNSLMSISLRLQVMCVIGESDERFQLHEIHNKWCN